MPPARFPEEPLNLTTLTTAQLTALTTPQLSALPT